MIRATFDLDGCYKLMVTSPNPTLGHDPRSVGLQLMHERISLDEEPQIETVLTLNLTPSHARAIASAILSAATDAARE